MKSDTGQQGGNRNPGAAIETTEITNLEGARVAWQDVKNACEIEGLTITEVCARYKLKYSAVYARGTRGRWKVISTIKKRAKELQKKEAELTTTASEWARRGDAHRDLVFNLAHRALAKAKLRPPRTFKEAKVADDMARKACGLDDRDASSDFLLIHINERVDGFEPHPIEASVIEAELPPGQPAPTLQEPALLNESGTQGDISIRREECDASNEEEVTLSAAAYALSHRVAGAKRTGKGLSNLNVNTTPACRA
jgi:hypothetical protein